MATTTHFIAAFLMKIFILSLWFGSVFAQSDESLIQEWTLKNESKLIEEYQIIDSDWFEQTCLQLALQLDFRQIVQCKLLRSDEINAYVFNNGHVYFTSSMLQLFTNKHQWAIVLAHENGHVVLKHYVKMLRKMNKPGIFFPKRRIKKMLQRHEKEADDYAKEVIQQHEFDYSQISYFLKKVQKLSVKPKNKTHLKLSRRIDTEPQKEQINQQMLIKIKQVLN